MEDKPEEEVEEVGGASSGSFVAGSGSDSEDEEPSSTSGQDDGVYIEEPLTEQEIEELVAEFLEVESKAAEAQEALEKESLEKVEREVREELSSTHKGDDLETAVEDEMNTLREEWEARLDELETESANLLEQLDGAGVELPKLYKWIESQASDSCYTDAWKRRAHWVGSQVTSEVTKSVADAENFLQANWPVRRRHGKLLEEGASGFLQKKLAADGIKKAATEGEVDWASLSKLFSGNALDDVASFGSKQWAAVYMANSPMEAAAMGLQFPGVDEVEEIEDIDFSSSDPFIAGAVANDLDLDLSEKQRKNYRKVNEEDDANVARKLQLHLKQRRSLKKNKQKRLSSGDLLPKSDEPLRCDDHSNIENGDNVHVSDTTDPLSFPVMETRQLKRPSESETDPYSKKSRADLIETNEADDMNDNHNVIVLEDELTMAECDGKVSADGHCISNLKEKFLCTVCDKVVTEVHAHPLLRVIVCKDCKICMEERLLMKDEDCLECNCGWCGRTGEFVTCTSCTVLFCTSCIRRNLGEDYLSKIQASRWQCCCCSPKLLDRLTIQLEKALGSAGVSPVRSDSDSENSDPGIGAADNSRRKHQKKIRRILDDAELGEDTKRKIAIEKERQERLKSLKVQFSAKSNVTSSVVYSGGLPESASNEMLGDATTGYIVNVVREQGEDIVRILPSISSKLKAHQVAGIRFLWENIVQSIAKVKSGDRGLGCILAHTMGLGKTFQVIAFLYTAMRCVDLGLRTALIVTPVNVLHNWKKEFIKWRPSESEIKPLRVYMLEDVPRERRLELLTKWRTKGGVFLIGYAAFRILSLGKNVKDRSMARAISCTLQDGPDLLVCDEAHTVKNTRADTTQALKLVRCQRRIALTGSPLQNNLMEYYCMVDFVREGFLGSSHEFRNRFQNPIENGQHTNSTAEDVKIMNQRSHILYEELKGFVQRMDMSVAKNDLPPKTVFVVAVKLSPLQRKLYKRFLDVHGFTKDGAPDDGIRKSFLAGYQALAQIWNHPGILQLRKDKDYANPEYTSENFLVDDGSSDENLYYNTCTGEKPNTKEFVQKKVVDAFFRKGWWNDILNESNYKELDYSGKMVLLLEILSICSGIGDKVLVFSQSILTLDLIELYLSKLSRHGKSGKYWRKGKDWYRLDGRTESSERQKLVEMFNDPDNTRVKCTLISTRAGSLGINLHAANRVVIVDGSWNPTYDLQAIYRAWRYGQKKPVFAYRLMAHGTMEEKIYKRQVTKEGLAARVVDRQQIHRMISKEEMLHLFEFGDEEHPDIIEDHRERSSQSVAGNSLHNKVHASPATCSSDKLMERLLEKHYPRWIANYHEHETYLQENEEEKLTKEEQDMAWEVYRRSLAWEEVQRISLDDPSNDRKQSVANMVPAPNPRGQLSSETAGVLPGRGQAASHLSELFSETAGVLPARGFRRSLKVQRKCTNLAHLLTLRSQGVKVGCSTICGECAEEISWDELKKTCR